MTSFQPVKEYLEETIAKVTLLQREFSERLLLKNDSINRFAKLEKA